MQGMETAYVGNGVSAGDASTTVGTEVIKAVAQKYQTNNQFGKATIEIDGFGTIENVTANATVSVYTTDFIIEGTINLNDGVLTWGEIEQNVPRISGMPTSLELNSNQLPYTINASLKGTTSTTITWDNGDSTVVNVSNGQLSLATDITGSSVTAIITASADGCESKTCEVTITKVATPQVGDIVNYAPSGKTYTWDKSLAEANGNGSVDLKNGTGETYNVTQWKVLRLYKENNVDKVDVVPTSPVGSLNLKGAQGYNNAVYLLDGACSTLYENSAKGITARSIKEEDFINASAIDSTISTNGGNKWLDKRASYTNSAVKTSDNQNVKYGEQKADAYTKSKYRYYPSIYAQEFKSVIDGTENVDSNSLRESQQLTSVVATEPNNTATNGYIKAGENGIQPYQTFYSNGDYTTISGLLENGKASVLMPNGSSTTDYWIATRQVNLIEKDACAFGVFKSQNGALTGMKLFLSYASNIENNFDNMYALFPVVTINANLLDLKSTSNGINTFDVK